MECKKNPKIDLQRKRTLFLQIGLLTSLSLVLFAFELKQYEKPAPKLTITGSSTVLEEHMITTREEKALPQTPTRIPLTSITIVDDLVMDDGDLEFIFDDPENFNPKTWKFIKPAEVDPPDTVVVRFPDIYASFKGGEDAMYAWLRANLTYPQVARMASIEGVVYVRFVVEKSGLINNPEVIQGNLGGGCEEAALDAVKRMPAWNPAKQRNRPVASFFVLPVQFQLTR